MMNTPDRKTAPEYMPAVLTAPEEPVAVSLGNGIQVYLIEAGTEEIMKVDFIFGAGQIKQELQLQSLLTNVMLLEGSERYSASELNRALDLYGAFINMFSEKDMAGISVYFLTKYIRQILPLCFELLFRPVFPADELETVTRKKFQSFLLSREKVSSLAGDYFFASIFGKNHPFGKMTVKEDFDKINRETVIDFHLKYYRQSAFSVIVSGKIHPDTLALLESHFGDLPMTTDTKGKVVDFPVGEKERKIRITKPGAVQSAIRIGSVTINKRNSDYPGLKVLDTILGGYFGSRLMKNIREEKGYTYGISSTVVSFDMCGFKSIGSEVGSGFEEEAVGEIYKEIRLLQERPVDSVELSIVKNYMMGELLRSFDGPFARSESFRSVWEFGLSHEYYLRLADKIRTIQPDEIIHLARTYYKLEELYEIIAGPE